MRQLLRQAWAEVGGLVLWLVSTVLMAPTLIVARSIVMRAATALGGGAWNMWVLSAIDQFGLLLLTLVGMLLVLYLAYHYQQGQKRRALWRRFGVVSGVQGATLALGWVLTLF